MTKTEIKTELLYSRGLIGLVELTALCDSGKISPEAFERISGLPYRDGE